MKKSVTLLALFATVGLTGCMSNAPKGDAAADQQAKQFLVQPGKSNLYIYRNEMLGAAASPEVWLDGKLVGETNAKTYFVLPVTAGKHSLVSKSATEANSALDIMVQSGKNAYVWQEIKVGMLTARSKLQEVDEKTGKEGVQECELLQAKQ
jgi:PBP1b-binding outer membrane lipoprotein LpoB